MSVEFVNCMLCTDGEGEVSIGSISRVLSSLLASELQKTFFRSKIRDGLMSLWRSLSTQ